MRKMEEERKGKTVGGGTIHRKERAFKYARVYRQKDRKPWEES